MRSLSLIFGVVLLPAAHTLKCFDCTPDISGSCTDKETECPLPGFQCGSLRITAYAGGASISDNMMKSCVLPDQCIEGSINFGIAKTSFSSKCCSSDLCNSQHVPDPAKSTPNGKKCYFCNGQTCTATLNCEGSEDHCVTATVDAGGQEMTMKGCATKMMCSDTISEQIKGSIGGKMSCCEGNFCNSGSSTSAGLLLLLAPLLLSVMFSY
ncbi:uncharacterized protein V6R79_010446 [Siganus canaliculatus]